MRKAAEYLGEPWERFLLLLFFSCALGHVDFRRRVRRALAFLRAKGMPARPTSLRKDHGSAAGQELCGFAPPNPGRRPGVAVKERCPGIWTCSVGRLPDAALVQFSGRTAQRTFRPCCCNLLYRGYGSDHAAWARPLPVERNALGNDCQSVHCLASK